MPDIVKELRNGNLSVSGEARHINALLALHRRAADEIERHRAKAGKYLDLHAFVHKVANDTHGCASPGLKAEAEAVLAFTSEVPQ